MNSMSSPFISFLSFCILFLHYEYLFFASAAIPYQAAPALYVFGDSLVDSGNNNFLQTEAKANYTPYGVDFFPTGTASGRFTNGYTIVDFIAKWLGLPYAPAYLRLSNEDKGRITTGVNYASGAGGILSETGSALGEVLSMGEQTNYFNKTVKEDLPRLFKNSELSGYLAKSIFVISIGSNDYINNYLQPAYYNSSKTSTPQQFGDLLLLTLKQHLTNLYNLGARKFVVFNIGPLGCLPAVVNSVIPKVNTTCVEDVNALVSIYNMGFPSMIQELSSNLQGSTFVRGEIYNDSYNKNQNPPKYGYIGGNTPCCPVGGNGTTQCLPNQAPCIDRNDRLYYDAFHPMQRVNYEVANGCFISSSPCVPINIQQLAQK